MCNAQRLEQAVFAVMLGRIALEETITGLAERLQFYNHYTGEPSYLSRDLGRHALLDAAALQAFANEVLEPSRRVIMHAAPAGGAR